MLNCQAQMTNTNKGEWLTILLKDIGWSPSDLARASKLETGVISNIQNGKRGIGTKTANKIARAVKRPTEYILRLAGELPIVDSADELSERADHLIKNYKSRATK